MRKNRGISIGAIIIGSAALATVVGVALYAYLDEDTRQHVQGVVNREKVKAYVRHQLKGSDKLVSMVDELSDNEVNTLVGLANKTNEAGNRMSEGFNEIIKRAKEVANDASDKVQDLMNN